MVSIKDVAGRAGVAISTVSKVLNHYPNVSSETRKKVEEAIRELNFVPNSVAAALSSKQAGRVALLLNLEEKTQITSEIGMQYLAGAMSCAMEHNLDVITVFSSMVREKSLEELIRYFQSQSITGIIIFGMTRTDKVLHQLVRSQYFKIVLVDAPISNENTSCVWVAQERAQYDVAQQTLRDISGKKVLYIAGSKESYAAGMRLEGMRRLAQDLKLSLLVRMGNFSELEARNITFQYASKRDIVVCASDMMAIGAMKALIEMDIFRPVCGFDGISLMGYAGKQMHTVKQDFAGIAGEAVRELRRLMNAQPGRIVEMPYELVRLQYEDVIK